MLQLQQFFGNVGTISKSKTRNIVTYSVSEIEALTNIIIPHFEKYQLLTQKAADFILFKRVVELKKEKAHLSIGGLSQIINIKSSMNFGLSDNLGSDFSFIKNKINPVDRPLILSDKILDPNWFSGFTTAE